MNDFGDLMRKRICMVAVAAALVACAADEMVTSAPRLTPRPKRDHFGASATAPGRLVACERRDVAADSALIGPSGGTLRVGANELVVPPGALIETVMLRGDVPADTVASIRLFPEGLEFRKPAGLVLDTEGCADPGSAPKVLYLDEAGNVLEEIDAYYSPWWHRVAAPHHPFLALRARRLSAPS